ncbi:MAG TPA: GNAT family N-acetyltransferase [Solirubrobacteraceae bacterium]|nr:GNAT family N-acetyltransferase [Solirubrobacteraceae bacterium]
MADERNIHIRALELRDHERVLELNQASVQELSALDEPRLRYILALAHRSLVAASDDGDVLAFALAIAPGTGYDSLNYTTLGEMFESFLYLDRIAVADRARRKGLGAALYDAMETAAAPFGRMVCDVNIEPRNDASLAFHAARGYREVGELAHGDIKTVALMSKELGAPARG